MGILHTINDCINKIPQELIDNKVLYVEIDAESYENLDKEFSQITNDQNFSILPEQKVPDMGKCIVFNYADYKIFITKGPMKSKQNDIYVAFKTKII